jgi:hypothetical protein
VRKFSIRTAGNLIHSRTRIFPNKRYKRKWTDYLYFFKRRVFKSYIYIYIYNTEIIFSLNFNTQLNRLVIQYFYNGLSVTRKQQLNG